MLNAAVGAHRMRALANISNGWDCPRRRTADPSKAAWWIAKRRQPFEQEADDYGCCIEMVRWRINITGAGRMLVS
jgi:hypothetical protein